jgi:hypothetical protein
MGTCKECVHWDRIDKIDDYYFGFCKSKKIQGKRDPSELPPRDGAIYNIGCNPIGTAPLCGGQDFGCIHFKAKEEEKG